VRWAQVTAENGKGLCFSAEGAPFELSVLPCTEYELDNADHEEGLPKPGATIVRVAAKQMGVGGDDSWGAPVHKEYLIPSDQPISFSFLISFCN
jgi:beta-galactosidase